MVKMVVKLSKTDNEDDAHNAVRYLVKFAQSNGNDDVTRAIEEILMSKSPVSETPGRGVCGLERLGNSSFINSVLQCMFATEQLTGYFTSAKFQKPPEYYLSGKVGFDDNFADCYSQLLNEVKCLNYDSSFMPTGFFNWVINVEKKFLDCNEQHEDAMDFWKNCFLVALNRHLDEERCENVKVLKNIFLGKYTDTRECLDCPPTEPCRSVETCQLFQKLSLPLTGSCTLVDMIAKYVKARKVIKRCDACNEAYKHKKARNVVVKRGIDILPPVLTIHLERFVQKRNVLVKDNRDVKFPLCLRWNASDGSDVVEVLEYDLYAVCYHVGPVSEEGRYVASCKVEGRWYLFDDEKVKEIESSQVEKPHGDHDAYILFYYKYD